MLALLTVHLVARARLCFAGEGSLPGMLPYAHKLPLDLHHVPEGDIMMQVGGCRGASRYAALC